MEKLSQESFVIVILYVLEGVLARLQTHLVDLREELLQLDHLAGVHEHDDIFFAVVAYQAI